MGLEDIIEKSIMLMATKTIVAAKNKLTEYSYQGTLDTDWAICGTVDVISSCIIKEIDEMINKITLVNYTMSQIEQIKTKIDDAVQVIFKEWVNYLIFRGNTHIENRKLEYSYLQDKMIMIDIHTDFELTKLGKTYMDVPSVKSNISETINNFNINGYNAKINMNSLDQSNNEVNLTDIKIFDDIKNTIEQNIADNDEKSKLLESVESMKTEKGSPKFIEKYKQFIENAANHMTILSPFLPVISKFLF